VREKLRDRFCGREPDAYELAQAMAMPQSRVEKLLVIDARRYISDQTLVYENKNENDKVVRVSGVP